MAEERGGERYVEVVLDTSAIEQGAAAQALRVVLQDQDGALTAETVDVGPGREATVRLAVGVDARAVRRLVPQRVDARDVPGLIRTGRFRRV
jgi:hypothetical protein